MYVRESLENNYNHKPVNPKKKNDSDHSSLLTMQSLSNLVQSGSIQIVNNVNGRYQNFSKYDMQVSYYLF